MATAKKPSNKPTSSEQYEQLGQMLTSIYESGYINHNQAYKMSFLKGLAGGLGGVIGATLIVALVIWLLSLFDNIPLVGPFVESIRSTVEGK